MKTKLLNLQLSIPTIDELTTRRLMGGDEYKEVPSMLDTFLNGKYPGENPYVMLMIRDDKFD